MEFYEEWRGDTLFRIYPCKNNNNKTEVKKQWTRTKHLMKSKALTW